MKEFIIAFKGIANLRLLSEYGIQDAYALQHINSLVICKMNEEQKELLRKEKSILAIERNEADEAVNGDTFDAEPGSQGESYAIELLQVKRYHDLGIKGNGVKVAVFDSGVQKHEDLIIAGGINAYDQTQPYDANLNNSHGTKVAGIIGMQDNGKGQLGVAPGCELYAVRLDDGVSTVNNTRWAEQIIGMDWAIQNNIDVINCSFSGYTESLARKTAFKAAHDAGIAIFGSAGNTQGNYPLNVDRLGYPARYSFVITTANINEDKTRYVASSVGSKLNFASGGVNVLSSTVDSVNAISKNYGYGLGTSYASPSVAGVYALYKQMFPDESRDKLLQRMYVNSEKIGDPWLFGAGIPKFPDVEYENIVINQRLE